MDEREEFNRENPDLPTYQELYLMTFELASKFGTPYYDNQMPDVPRCREGHLLLPVLRVPVLCRC